jgi:hypothetical protein
MLKGRNSEPAGSKARQRGRSRELLRDALPLVQQETGTTAWFTLQFDTSTACGQIARALKAKAPELFAKTPVIENADVLAAKLLGASARLPRAVG